MKQITCYKCQSPGCGKIYQKEFYAVKHAAECWLDPENHGCRTCRHYAWDRYVGPQCFHGLLTDYGECSMKLPVHCNKWEAVGR